jgi:hypothetical protein
MLACPHLPLSRFEACLRHPNALRWRELECRSKGSARVPGLFFRSVFYLQIETKGRADERTRTADLISLRVISQALQRLAGVCKSRIDRLISFLCLALCCTVLRSRWYQSGIKRSPVRPPPRRVAPGDLRHSSSTNGLISPQILHVPASGPRPSLVGALHEVQQSSFW